MTREEFINLQIGACKVRAQSANESARYYRDMRANHPEKMAVAFLAGETTAANNKMMNEAEAAYWRRML